MSAKRNARLLSVTITNKKLINLFPCQVKDIVEPSAPLIQRLCKSQCMFLFDLCGLEKIQFKLYNQSALKKKSSTAP